MTSAARDLLRQGRRSLAHEEYAEADEWYAQALVAAQNEADRAAAHVGIGDVRLTKAEYGRAEESYGAALGLAPAGTVEFGAALLGLAHIEAQLGDYADAVAKYRRAEQIFRREDPIRVAECLSGIATIESDRGNHRTAENLFLEVLGHLEPPTSLRTLAQCRLAFADALCAAGRATDAVVLINSARAAFKKVNDVEGVASCDLATGQALCFAGDLPAAGEAIRKARRRLKKKFNLTHKVAEADAAIGAVFAQTARLDKAEKAYRRALVRFDAAELEDEAADCRLNLGILALRSGRFDEAQSYADAARAAYFDLEQMLDVARADFLRAEVSYERANSTADDVRAALGLAIPALLYIDARRFEFPTARARRFWSAAIDRETNLVFTWAYSLDDARLMTELIEVDINFGVPTRSAAAQPMIPVHRSKRPLARIHETRSGARRLVAGAALAMKPGPRLLMPDNQEALADYFRAMEDRYGTVDHAPGPVPTV